MLRAQKGSVCYPQNCSLAVLLLLFQILLKEDWSALVFPFPDCRTRPGVIFPELYHAGSKFFRKPQYGQRYDTASPW